MSVPVFIAGINECRTVQLVSCSLDPTCRSSAWAFRILRGLRTLFFLFLLFFWFLSVRP